MKTFRSVTVSVSRSAKAAAAVTIAVSGALLAACTSSPDTEATASSRMTCINPIHIRKQEIVSDQEIRFVMAGGDVWVNNLPHRCPGLKFQGGFSWEVRGSQICSNIDVIHVLDMGTPCRLGEFSKLDPEKAAAESQGDSET
ncbi:MAG: DUF6491 family protein [Hyphomonadaceae bacterium]